MKPSRSNDVARVELLRHVAERAGMQRKSLYCALSPRGNPTVKTLLAVLGAAGLKLEVKRDIQPAHGLSLTCPLRRKEKREAFARSLSTGIHSD